MPREDSDAGEPDEAEEIAGFDLVAGVDAAAAQQPGEEPLYVPATFVAAQAPAVLGLGVPRMVRSYEDNPSLFQLSIEGIAVVRLVADQEPRERPREARVDGFGDELLLMSRTTRNPCSDRKTRAV